MATIRQLLENSDTFISTSVVNLIKHLMIVIYNSRVVWLENCLYYDSRVIIYACQMFIRFATGQVLMGGD